jgi:hypothetical protein
VSAPGTADEVNPSSDVDESETATYSTEGSIRKQHWYKRCIEHLSSAHTSTTHALSILLRVYLNRRRDSKSMTSILAQIHADLKSSAKETVALETLKQMFRAYRFYHIDGPRVLGNEWVPVERIPYSKYDKLHAELCKMREQVVEPRPGLDAVDLDLWPKGKSTDCPVPFSVEAEFIQGAWEKCSVGGYSSEQLEEVFDLYVRSRTLDEDSDAESEADDSVDFAEVDEIDDDAAEPEEACTDSNQSANVERLITFMRAQNEKMPIVVKEIVVLRDEIENQASGVLRNFRMTVESAVEELGALDGPEIL